MKHRYRPTATHTWEGRVDDPDNRDAFRWHQIVQIVDIETSQLEKLPGNRQGFCFLGFQSDEGVKRNKGRTGTARAPLSIRKEMANLACHFPQDTILLDAGDIICGDGKLEEAQDKLAETVNDILSMGLFPIILGGGHETAFGHFKGILGAISKSQPGSHFKPELKREKLIGIINFDAHFDLRPYQEGGSSGSPFLQVADFCRDKGIDFSYFCLGIQTYGNTVSLFKTANALRVEYILAKEILEKNLSHVKRKLKRFIKKHEHIYLTICCDVFSSAFAPGVSAPQPFGLHPEVVLDLLKFIIKTGKVLSADIAEVSPRFDDDSQTAKLAAITIYSLVNGLSGG